MKRSQMLLNTLKEIPAEAEISSHKLMLRAGMIRKLAAGIYDFLPLAVRVLRKIEQIVREEMNRAGAQEVLLPSVIPSELWKETGRWDQYGRELLRIRDRHDREFCFGPTHEEVITDLARREVRSYKHLPVNLYQIQTKFRDEIRPRFGVMRAREFIMKDGYSFDISEESSEETYGKMHEAYCRIFERCGLRFRAVLADSGNIGGSFSHEFMVLADSGEDEIASCCECDYAANMEKAQAREVTEGSAEESGKKKEQIHTPGKKSVDEVCAFLGISRDKIVKTLIFETDSGVVAALVRGDHEVNETKLKKTLKTDLLTLAGEKIVLETTRAPSGFAGPLSLDIEIIADSKIRGMVDFVTGANEKDSHFINVNLDRDFTVSRFADIRNVVSGDPCPECGGKLKTDRGIEVGHIFKLGTRYSKSMGATCLDSSGKQIPMVMGCYGIGVSRVIAAAIEQNFDEGGIIWPFAIAPFHVVVMPLNINHTESVSVASSLYEKLREDGVETLYDDRKERAGVKFKDADLIGIPVQVIIGEKTLKDGSVEMKIRRSGTRKTVSVDEAYATVKGIIQELALGANQN